MSAIDRIAFADHSGVVDPNTDARKAMKLALCTFWRLRIELGAGFAELADGTADDFEAATAGSRDDLFADFGANIAPP